MAKSQTLNEKIYLMSYYIKKNFRSLRLRHLPPFDWKFLQIGILRPKDLIKNVLILQKGGFTTAPLTLLAIRVVLLHMLYGELNPLIPQLYLILVLISIGNPPRFLDIGVRIFMDKVSFVNIDIESLANFSKRSKDFGEF